MKKRNRLAPLCLLLAALLLTGCGMDAFLPREMETPPESDGPETQTEALPEQPSEEPVEETPEEPVEEIPEELPPELVEQAPEEPAEEAPAETEAPAPVPEEPAPSQEAASSMPVAPDPASLPPLPELDINSWQFMLGNSYNSVAFYYPKETSYFEAQGMDRRIYDDAVRMITDARAAGCTIYIAVGYRNQDYMLYQTINGMYAMPDAREAWKHTQPMGSSEHQMGLGIDFTDDVGNICSYEPFWDGDAASSATFQWLMEHCQDYGFIYRYPAEKQAWYGTPCGHWHFRYVGLEAARYIMENDLCLEEFLRLYDPNAAFIPEHGNIYE